MPLPNAAQKILNVVAHHKAERGEGVEVGQISSLTGIAGASTVRNGYPSRKKALVRRTQSGPCYAQGNGPSQFQWLGCSSEDKR
mmetsp:Transcript_602/g.1227  ORF Transcript_602/g.1227 Transcript_602/m.1227 type:complete len:84 (+) Transcript_602:552-803(+)